MRENNGKLRVFYVDVVLMVLCTLRGVDDAINGA
jgi:hypothetical protein